MIRRPPRSTLSSSSAASDVYKRQDRKRRNIFDLVEYLRSEGLLYSANHLFQSYRMRQAPEDFFTTMLELFDVFEVKNGSMAYQHNALVEDLLTAAKEKRGSLALVGGSDAHTYPCLLYTSP